MEKYYINGILCANINAQELKKIQNSFALFKGTVQKFYRLYFGEPVYIDQVEANWHIPERLVCPNSDMATQLYHILREMEYNDRFNQRYCEVSVNGRFIDIIQGEY